MDTDGLGRGGVCGTLSEDLVPIVGRVCNPAPRALDLRPGTRRTRRHCQMR